MKKSNHFNHRAASRGYRDSFLGLALEHGDYIEQKGDCYVLALFNSKKLHDLKLQFSTEEQELLHKKRNLRRRRKVLGLSLVKPSTELRNINDEARENQQKLRALKRKRKAIKSGYVVIGNKGNQSQAITVAPKIKSVRGHKILYE